MQARADTASPPRAQTTGLSIDADGSPTRMSRDDDVPPDPSNLASLAARAKSGDREAFGELYRLRGARVFAYLAKILRNRATADDATAETFLQAWKGIGKLRDPARFDGWLFRIAHHVAMDAMRDPPTADLDDAPEPVDAGVDRNPEAAANRRADERRLRAALLDLPDRYREVLVLRYFGDRSDEEVAAQLGTSRGNVRALRMRAMRRLRTNLDRGE